MRERTSDSDLECEDSVEVKERGKRLMRMCGESQTDIRLLSERNVLEVEYRTDVETTYIRSQERPQFQM